MTTPPVIRPLTLPEVGLLLEWARQEGWNPGLEDAAVFHAADPEGFIGCFLEDTMVAAISAVRYGDSFGFIGLYICRPDYRGKGLGKLVWESGMHQLEGRIVGLDGVPEQQPYYRRMDFAESYKTIRWSGRVGDIEPAHEECHTISDEMLAEVLAYDRQKFPAGRDQFIRAWLQPARLGIVVLHQTEIAGYAVLRRCHDGYKIGPLFADGLPEAKQLLAACASQVPDALFHLDVPETQEAFSQLLRESGMASGFVTARMYKNGSPAVYRHGIFAITTLELG